MLIFSCYWNLKAQGGELQFSETKLFTKTISTPTKKTHSRFGVGSQIYIDTSYYYWDSLTIIVPANKTLKIENISLGSSYPQLNEVSNGTFSSAYSIPSFGDIPYMASSRSFVSYNGTVIYSSSTSFSSSPAYNFPIWLPSGTHKIIIFNAYLTAAQGAGFSKDIRVTINNTKIYCAISAIEFNIIP